MKRKSLVSIAFGLFVILSSTGINAQNNGSVAEKKFEVGTEFATMTFGDWETKIGFGGRLTYNLNSHVALETATYFFPGGCDFCGRNGGQVTEVLGGVKVGKRWNKWGLFAKVRPGIITSSQGQFEIQLRGVTRTDPPSFFIPSYAFVPKRVTSFAADVGGVVEFYPTKRIITRFDYGVTMARDGQRTINFQSVDFMTGVVTSQRSTIPAQTNGMVQFSAGVGFRF